MKSVIIQFDICVLAADRIALGKRTPGGGIIRPLVIANVNVKISCIYEVCRTFDLILDAGTISVFVITVITQPNRRAKASGLTTGIVNDRINEDHPAHFKDPDQ